MLDFTSTEDLLTQLAPGKYGAKISNAMVTTNRSGQKVLLVQYVLPRENRKVSEQFFLWSEDEKKSRFAKSKLKNLLLALNEGTYSFLNEDKLCEYLKEKDLAVKVDYYKGTDGKEYLNIASHMAVGESSLVQLPNGKTIDKKASGLLETPQVPTSQTIYTTDDIPF